MTINNNSHKKGRPFLPKGKGKDIIVSLRLTPEDKRLFDQAAKDVGMSISDWLRHAAKVILDHGSK